MSGYLVTVYLGGEQGWNFVVNGKAFTSVASLNKIDSGTFLECSGVRVLVPCSIFQYLGLSVGRTKI